MYMQALLSLPPSLSLSLSNPPLDLAGQMGVTPPSPAMRESCRQELSLARVEQRGEEHWEVRSIDLSVHEVLESPPSRTLDVQVS